MDLITELAFVLAHNPTKSFDLLLPSKTKTRKLYDAIIKGKVKNDEQAANYMYDGSDKDKKYLMLKRNLVNKLVELVLISEYKELEKSNYISEKFECEKLLTVAEKLLLENVYHNAEIIINKVKKSAEKFGLADILLACFLKLRKLNYLKGYPLETMMFQTQVEQAQKNLIYNENAQGMWQIIESRTKFFLSRSPELIYEMEQYISIINKWFEEVPSPFIKLYLLRLETRYFKSVLNVDRFKKSIDEILELQNVNPHIITTSLLLDTHLMLADYYQLIGNYHKASAHIKICLKHSDYRAFNQFEVQSLNFSIHIKEKKYIEAGEILLEVTTTNQFELLDNYDKAAWLIKEAFLYVLFFSLGHVDEINKYTKRFSKKYLINDLLAQCQVVNKDKQGYNTQIQIVRLMLMHIKGNEDLINEGNNLNTYYYRYLKDIVEQRSANFILTLSHIASSGFNINVISSFVEHYSFDHTNSNLELRHGPLELVPYEHLLECLISFHKLLKKKTLENIIFN